MKTLSLQGDHYEMGRQHGHQVLDLREMIIATMEARLCRLEACDTNAPLRALETTWQDIAPSTLAMLRGMADALALPFQRVFAYAAASYLDDLRLGSSGAEGCTVWAGSRSATRDRSPIMTKNRDYAISHRPLQALAYAVPRRGYRSVYVTSAGSPAVFSSGMNERGLAVADTHVSSRDIGPGLSRYTLMMNLLEQHADVASALGYLREVSQMGAGNLVMADAAGDLAVCESGYRHHGILRAEGDLLVATNHFVSAVLADACREEDDLGARADSRARYDAVRTVLREAHGTLDAENATKLMARHANHGPAICRHTVGTDSGTISNVIFLPSQRRLLFCDGFPCQSAHTVHSL